MTDISQSGKGESLEPRLVAALDWLRNTGQFGIALLCVLNGVLLSRAFAPLDIWPLVFVTLSVALVLIWHSATPFSAFVRGWWTGIGFFAVGLSWIGHSFQMQGPNPGVPPELAPLAVFGLSAFLSLYVALAFWLTKRLTQSGFWSLFVFAASWTMMEFLRGTLFSGFPWHLLSAVWVNWLAPLQSLYWISSYGLTFVTALAGAGLATLLLSASWKVRFSGPVLSLIVMGALVWFGAHRLQQTPTDYNPAVSLRVVQPNITQPELYQRSRWGEYFSSQLQLSRGGSNVGRADGVSMVIWPETSVRGLEFDRDNSVNRWQVGQMLEWDAFAVVGGARYERDENGRPFFYNSLMAVSAEGKIAETYDKVHLVPFGEYLPFASFFEAIGISHLTGGSAFTAGPRKKTIELGNLPGFSPLICYEVVFPGEAVGSGPRPEWLLTITNDGWFGSTEGPHQHMGLARMRAVEEGLPIVRSAITGISAVVDPLGRTLKSLPIGARGTINSDLPLSLDAPISTKRRIIFVNIFCLVIVLFAIIRRKTSTNKSNSK